MIGENAFRKGPLPLGTQRVGPFRNNHPAELPEKSGEARCMRNNRPHPGSVRPSPFIHAPGCQSFPFPLLDAKAPGLDAQLSSAALVTFNSGETAEACALQRQAQVLGLEL